MGVRANLRTCQLMAIVRSVKVEDWSFGNNASWVDVGMTLVVMHLDVFKVTRFLDSWLLVEVFEIVPEVGIFVNMAQVALEVDVIHRVKTEQSREHTPVGFGDAIATKIALLLQHSFPII
jgi:hypothetical protein